MLRKLGSFVAVAALLGASSSAVAQVSGYSAATAGTRLLQGRGGFAVKMLVEESNLGGTEVEIGEITFPAGSQGGGHRHGSIEIFYILSGELDHIVNEEHHRLAAGMVGIVRQGDTVVHRVLSDEDVRALVVWVPGGEAAGIARFTTEVPLDQ